MSSSESISPLMTRRVKKISSAAYKSTPTQKKRDVASKLSLKKPGSAKENVDQFGTPEAASSHKVLASFIFSSCKKKQLATTDSLPGHSILVGDSSDEEFINSDLFADIAKPNDEVVDESLVEYSLIRKWLQNAEDSFSSVNDSDLESHSFPYDSDSKNKNKEILNRVGELKNNSACKQEIKDNTIVLSSDDEIDLARHKIKVTKALQSSPLSSNSVLADSFDSPCFTKSLKERLANQEKSSYPYPESNSDSESFPKISKPFKKPVALCISSDAEVSSSPERLPRRSFQAKQQEISSTKYFKTPKTIFSDSEFEDLFAVSLTINEEPPAPIIKDKKLVKPSLKKRDGFPKILRQTAFNSERNFLASLSSEVPHELRHLEAIPYMKHFRKNRQELTSRLFKMFNEEIFNNYFQPNFSITWNSRLTRTAGYCRHFTKRESGTTTFESRIELSVKVVDTPCRLRDTLIHELCHAATWIIDNCRGGHGPVWRKWANKALHIFPELPPITRCHNYEISYKFYYNCVSCTYSVGRHSKSIDIATHVCPICRGQLQLCKEPSSRLGEHTEATPKTKIPRTPNAFALFVKDNYAAIKSSRTDLPHAAVMKLLSAKFAENKLKLI